MKHTYFLPLAAVILTVFSCVSSPDSLPPADSAWVGTYAGTVPSASGSGIKTTLTLAKDGSWTLVREYLGREGGAFTTQGAIEWSQGGTVIRLAAQGEEPVWFMLESGRAIMLDSKGKRVGGALADAYILTLEADATSSATSEGW